jgi:hypothetical protein
MFWSGNAGRRLLLLFSLTVLISSFLSRQCLAQHQRSVQCADSSF